MRGGLTGICLALIAVSPALANDWHIQDTTSAFDGSRKYAALVNSTNTIHTPIGSDDRATLVVRCMGGRLDAYIAWPQALGTGPLDMQWKTDGDASTTDVWTVSPDGTGTFSENARAMIAKLRIAHRADFQLMLADSDALQVSFNIDGAADVADTATAACSR